MSRVMPMIAPEGRFVKVCDRMYRISMVPRFVLISITLLAICLEPASAQFFNRGNRDEAVELVRSGTFYDHPGKAIGPTIETVLDGVEWNSFVSQAGQTVVEMRGMVSQRVRDSKIDRRADEVIFKLQAVGQIGVALMLNPLTGTQAFKDASREVERDLPCGVFDDCLNDEQFFHHAARLVGAFELNYVNQWQVGDEVTFQFVVGEDMESFELAVTHSDSFNQLSLDQVLEPIFSIGNGLIR